VRFMLLLKYDEAAASATPPDPAMFEEMGRFNTAMVDAGVLLAGEGLMPSAQGAVVAFDGEEPTVSDGPFTEAKELVGGFAILEAQSKQEAIELTKAFLAVAGDGECEVRELYTQQDTSRGDTATQLAEQFAR
jgi:hypothetical protein